MDSESRIWNCVNIVFLDWTVSAAELIFLILPDSKKVINLWNFKLLGRASEIPRSFLKSYTYNLFRRLFNLMILSAWFDASSGSRSRLTSLKSSWDTETLRCQEINTPFTWATRTRTF
jgi:hypothetical protein